MENSNRINEIRGNLKQDTKALLEESARLVTNVFKRGLCTVRAAANKWRQFASDISTAADTLMQPSFISGADAPNGKQAPDGQPMVTVAESQDPRFPVGQQMTLTEANGRVKILDASDKEQNVGKSVKFQIDYVMDGEPDRYWTTAVIGLGGGSLLDQIKSQIKQYQRDQLGAMAPFSALPMELRDELKAHFTPLVLDGLEAIPNRLVSYFQHHCDISKIERSFQDRAELMPETARNQFLQMAENSISDLRSGINSDRPAVTVQAMSRSGSKPSVRLTLRQIKEDGTAKSVHQQVPAQDSRKPHVSREH